MTPEIIKGYDAARARLNELEDELAKDGNYADGYCIHPIERGDRIRIMNGDWEIRFVPNKWAIILNTRARKQLLRAAGVSPELAGRGSGPYPYSDADEVAGV